MLSVQLWSFSLFLASSCSKTNDVKEAGEPIEQQEAFNELLGNLDCLNSDFGITTTKGGGRDALKSAADIAGYVAGNTWGADVGAWAGSAAGPVGSVVGFLVGKKYGGVVGSQIFSLIAGYGYDLFSGCQIIAPAPVDSNIAFCEPEDDATIGEVHNYLLSIMNFQEEEFVSDDGYLNIEAICNKSFENAKAYKIEDNLCENEEYVAFIKDLSKEIENIAYAMATNSTGKSCEQSLKDLLTQRTNLSETEADNLFALSSTLRGSSDMEESVVEEYEQAFADLVNSSELSDDNKNCVKAVGSIAIRGNYYWYAKK